MKNINLHNIIDAQMWVDEWFKFIKEHPNMPFDKSAMLGWFTTAIMTGYDCATQKCKCDPNEHECCDVCTGWSDAMVHGRLKDKK